MENSSDCLKTSRLLALYGAATFWIIVLNLHAQNVAFSWGAWIKGGDLRPTCITTDANGNVFTTGSFVYTTDFDPLNSNYALTPGPGTNNRDTYIAKYSGTGSFLWSKHFFGGGLDAGAALVTDASGNIYTVGDFYGTADFNPGTGTYNMSSLGNTDCYISKLDANGNFVWAKQIGGTGWEFGADIKLDASGNIYITGSFSGGPTDFDPGTGVYTMTPIGATDAYLVKLNSSGAFVWAKQFGGTNNTYATGLSVDGAGNVYSCGNFNGNCDFDPGITTFSFTSLGDYDVYISKLDGAGSFIWASRVGGAGRDESTSMSLDAGNNVYTCGNFAATADFDPGPSVFTMTSNGGADVFISKLTSSGNFAWSRSFGGNANDDYCYEIVNDGTGNVIATGYFFGTVDFDPGPSVFTLSEQGGLGDSFILELNSGGNLNWAKQIGGNGLQSGSSVFENAGNIFATGQFQDVCDIDPGVGTYTLVSQYPGDEDAYIIKLAPCSSPAPPVSITPASNLTLCANRSATLSATASGYITWYLGTLTIGTGTSIITPSLAANNYTFFAEAMTCTNSASMAAIHVTVLAVPALSISSSANPVCSGDPVTVTASGATSYSWLPAGAGQSIQVNPTSSSGFTVIGTGANSCSNKATILINVMPLPTVQALATPSNVCSGETVTLSAGGAATYSWTGLGSMQSFTFSLTNTTVFVVYGTGQNGCTGTSSINVLSSICTYMQKQPSTQLSIYPNPASGQFKIDTTVPEHIEIRDLLGNLVSDNYLTPGVNMINLSGLPQGVYIISLVDTASIEKLKLVLDPSSEFSE